jgi:4'-phosphopantetheinyl transferase
MMLNHSKLAIDENAIDIWLTFYNEIAEEHILSQMRNLLTEDESRNQSRFRFADDQKRYLVTRAMVRTVLSHYTSIHPSAWTFSANEYGRPTVSNALEGASELRFNVSHTTGLIAMAVGLHRELGVDVENFLGREIATDVINSFFSPFEIAEMAMVPLENKQRRFLEYWTLKEAYIKARGMGLSLPLDKFTIVFPREGIVRIAIDAELRDDENRWSFWQYLPTAEHLLALCAEKRGDNSTLITVRKTIPTCGHEVFAMTMLKTSEASPI